MYRIYIVIWLWFCFTLSAIATDNFIVLAHGDNNSINIEQKKYENLFRKNINIDLKSTIKNMDSIYILEVGPFKNSDKLAINYMILKDNFPEAVIVEHSKPIINKKSIEKNMYVDRNIVFEKDDIKLWIALFGLAFIGILFMFLSSNQIKYLKSQHEKIKLKHKELEKRQHEVITSMSENIHTIAKETMNTTNKLAKRMKDTSLYGDMKKVIYNENELLYITGDLIKFLRLKSKKVVINNEVFNFNHVLNEVAGSLHNIFKQNNMELIFDVDKKVPRYMLSDSLHLGQILINLLEYSVQNSKNNEIILKTEILSTIKDGLHLRFKIDTNMIINNKDTLFDTYYDEELRHYVGLGLFVAKELIYLMDGNILVQDNKNGYTSLVFVIPIKEDKKKSKEENKKYHLSNKILLDKKILIVDKSPRVVRATEKLFSSFGAEITAFSRDNFEKNIPNFINYDIVILSSEFLDLKILQIVKSIKEIKDLRFINLDNLFSSTKEISNSIIDSSLKKPLTQEYIFDTLIKICEQDLEKSNNIITDDSYKLDTLKVNREPFNDAKNITLDSFKIFNGANILIVEDNIINQKVLMNILSKSEMVLDIANNGQEAVDFMNNTTKKIDFIFMDINMPIMDGYSASKNIRSNDKFNNTPIVSLTALVSEHEIEKMFDSGMNGYLSKPINIDKLYSALEMFLIKKDLPTVEIIEKEKKIITLEGLDVACGLSHMQNNDIFYKEVLSEFIDAYRESDIVFEKLVREHRFVQIKMLCLDMIGLTGTIGAKEMHILINEINQQLIYNKPELIHSYVSKYQRTFNTLMISIKQYLSN